MSQYQILLTRGWYLEAPPELRRDTFSFWYRRFAKLLPPTSANVELPPELSQHTRFVLESESGHIGFVHGDSNMSEETKDALRQLIDAAHKAIDRGEIEPENDEE